MKGISTIAAFVSTVSALTTQSVSAQGTSQTQAPVCYELKVGPWTPPLGSAAQFSTPPDTVELFGDASQVNGLRGWKRATPPIRHSYSSGREHAFWKAPDSTSIRIIWSDGFTGADMRLFSGERAYFGVVRMLSDAIGPEKLTPKATVVATRVECKLPIR